VKDDVEAERKKIAAILGESKTELPAVVDMMSEKGTVLNQSKQARTLSLTRCLARTFSYTHTLARYL